MSSQDAEAAERHEARRKKHKKRMSKILTRAWSLPDAEPFQQTSHPSETEVRDLATVGENLDKGKYEHGRSGWEIFAKDMGLVYNRHIGRKGKHASAAKSNLDEVVGFFAKIDPILGDFVVKSKPGAAASDGTAKKSSTSKKRKNDAKDSSDASPKKKANGGSNGTMTLSQREKRAIEVLVDYLAERGGKREQGELFQCKVAERPGGRYDKIYISAENKRFKSMAEVARFLNLVKAPKATGGGKGPKKTNKETEKKKLKRDLDKLTKSRAKAVKALDAHTNDTDADQLPTTDESLWDDGSNSSKAHRAGSIVPQSDIGAFPGIPTHCIPEMLLVWDFLCTFGRTLSLQPIELDDFAAALSFRSSEESMKSQSDEERPPLPPESFIPVYLSECHIAILRLLVKDPSSDFWWWSVLETPEMVEQEDEYLTPLDKKRKAAQAVVKIDMEALLSAEEDPAVTRKWLKVLEDVRGKKPENGGTIKSSVRSAISVTTNPLVKVYLKKAMRTWKPHSAGLVKRAVVWLVDKVREARPDLWGRNVSDGELADQKKLVAAEAALEMDNVVEDVNMDVGDVNLEGDSDEESDSDDDEGSDNEGEYADQADVTPASPGKPRVVKENDEITPVSTFVPPKPLPSVVDLLLPPGKPEMPTDLVHALTWPPVIGATTARIFQWYKRRRNEVDDSIREFRELRPMSIAERHRRELSAPLRILSECGDPLDNSPKHHVESAITHLCGGKGYLDLNAVQRLCILRLLIEAAYDTQHVQLSIEDNFKSRINAVKALDAEERRAKKGAREELAALETAARERLATEARETFMVKKRQELIEDLDPEEYSAEFIQNLDDEDVIDIDDDVKAEYEALPTPESFNKVEVNAVVKMIQEETAFGVERLTVLTLAEIEKRDEDYLKSLQDEMDSIGDIDSRETSAKVDRLRQRITKFTDQMQSLPEDRSVAIEALKEAMEDGTVRTLRAAIKEAKLAELSGDDEVNGGVWALDLMRDASLELKKAEGRKRVTEAQKDLVAKRNKCFIRTEPLGRDRYQSSFVHFDHDESNRVWAERDLVLTNEDSALSKGAVLLESAETASVCAPDTCDDFVNRDDRDQPYGKSFLSFARQEYHHTGELATLARHHWSCYTTDRSLRVLVKNLDAKCPKENSLKEVLKETLETMALAAAESNAASMEDTEATADAQTAFNSSGDEEAFAGEKGRLSNDEADLLKDISSAIGRRVRLRQIPDPDRAPDVAEYTIATVTGWKMDDVPQSNGADHEAGGEKPAPQARLPIWKLGLDDGGELHVSASETIQGIVRAIKWSTNHPGYVELDAPFLSYRNSLGRFCGRAVEAPSSLTPQAFAKHLIKREQDFYTPLKNRTFENNWGGKAGARQVWVASLKESGHTFDAVRDGLLTLETAFFDLTGGFPSAEEKKEDENEPSPPAPPMNGGGLSGKDLLYDDTSRFDIELESLAPGVQGLWNDQDTREIFHEIVRTTQTVSVLALGLDLICRNAQAYITRTESSAPTPTSAAQPAAYVGRRRAAMAGSYANFF